jgi:hypothetical protein
MERLDLLIENFTDFDSSVKLNLILNVRSLLPYNDPNKHLRDVVISGIFKR